MKKQSTRPGDAPRSVYYRANPTGPRIEFERAYTPGRPMLWVWAGEPKRPRVWYLVVEFAATEDWGSTRDWVQCPNYRLVSKKPPLYALFRSVVSGEMPPEPFMDCLRETFPELTDVIEEVLCQNT